MINFTNNTLTQLIFCKDCIFFKVKKREKRGGKKISLELHRVWGCYTRQTTMKEVARRIKCCPKMWCSTIERYHIRQQLFIF
jgi:hypothetical protein